MIENDLINIKYLLIPVISAFIGWLTNWIAIKMLFHPKKPIKLVFFTLHGIFHRRQKDIAHKLGHTIEEKLFSHNDIHAFLTSEEFVDNIMPKIESYLDDFIVNRLVGIHPMLALLPENMIVLIKEKLMEEFKNLIPHIMNNAEDIIEKNLRIKEKIREKIEQFNVSELEEILFSILKSEFKMIEYIGGVLGFFIGVAQLLIIHFL